MVARGWPAQGGVSRPNDKQVIRRVIDKRPAWRDDVRLALKPRLQALRGGSDTDRGANLKKRATGLMTQIETE